MVFCKYSDGRSDRYPSLDAAITAIREEYPDAVFYDDHGEEVFEGLDYEFDHNLDRPRILVWRTKEESIDDPGAYTIATITQEAP